MKTQKRLAARILKVGESRVWIDPEAEDVEMAMTHGDIRKFIGLGLIKPRPEKGNSRGRTRKAQAQKKKGRRRGLGTRKGGKTARLPKKKRWMKKIRAQRKVMKELRDSGKITPRAYREAYGKSKAGVFRDKAHLRSYLKEQK
jgi:large subunit ribosomal protein L19e